MLLVDTVKGEVVDDEKLKEYYASREPYGEWIDRNLVQLKDLKIPNIKVPSYTGEELDPPAEGLWLQIRGDQGR